MTDKQLAVLIKSYLARLNIVRDDMQEWIDAIDTEYDMGSQRIGFVLQEFDNLIRSIKNDVDNLND